MTRILIILFLLFLTRHSSGQTFLESYKLFCNNKINSSIHENIIRSSDLNDKTNTKIKIWNTRLKKRLDFQIKKLTILFDTYRKKNGYNFNQADSLTMIFNTTNNSSFSDFMIWSQNDTLRSTNKLALARQVNNGGGRLEPLKEGATDFKISKTDDFDANEPVLELSIKSDTAFSYNLIVDCPVGFRSIIVTAKRNNKKYIIVDYYLHEFEFVSVRDKQ